MRSFCVLVFAVVILGGPVVASADDGSKAATKTSRIPIPDLTTPIIVKLSIDPPVRGAETKCTEDGMLHLREGVIKVCVEGSWQAANFSR